MRTRRLDTVSFSPGVSPEESGETRVNEGLGESPRAGAKLLGLSWWLGGALLGSSLFACGGGQTQVVSPADQEVHCPAGQHFDGSFCVATHQPVPKEKQPAPPESSSSPSEKEAEPPAQPETVEPDGASVEPPPEEEQPPAPAEAAPVDVTMASAAAPFIQYLASAHLPAGARPFGAPFAGQFAEGQILQQRVQLSVGRCYTVVAAGAPPVRELNVALYALDEQGQRQGGEPLATDADQGAQAVLGRRNTCFQPLEGQTQLLLVLQVAEGNGVAAAQVYEK